MKNLIRRTNIVIFLRLRTMTQSVALTGDVEDKYEILVGNPKEKRSFGKLRHRQANNKKVNTKLTLHRP
jgi:hypothetical protein